MGGTERAQNICRQEPIRSRGTLVYDGEESMPWAWLWRGAVDTGGKRHVWFGAAGERCRGAMVKNRGAVRETAQSEEASRLCVSGWNHRWKGQ